MKTCYLVSKETGDSWEYYEYPVKVFLSKENAEKFINNDPIPRKADQLKISIKDFQEAEEVVSEIYPEDFTTPVPELIIKTGKFSEWSLKDLQMTEQFIQRSENKWIGYKIEELELCQ